MSVFGWQNLPDLLLLQIFHELNLSDIATATRVCKNWNRVSQDEVLWKNFFNKDFKLSPRTTLPNGRLDSWKLEYKRLMDELPVIECQDIIEHTNEVLHVSFSNNGSMFATSSKDSCIMVWSSNHPCSVLYFKLMTKFSWRYTQFSQFNSTDELLLVSGVHYGEASTSGEIVILKLEEDLPLQCRSINRPYDLFGTWYNSQYFLSGEFHWLGQLRSANLLWLNRASQEAHSEHIAVILRFCQFFNRNAASVRSLMVCDVHKDFKFKPVLNKKTDISESPPLSQEAEHKLPLARSPPPEAANHHVIATTSGASAIAEPCPQPEPDKLLIFTTGSLAFTPHEIGIQEIRRYCIDTQVRVSPEIHTRIMRRRAEKELKRQGVLTPRDEVDMNKIEENFDSIDHLIDLKGQIIGMALSPDKRFLYVNCRAWIIDDDDDVIKPLFPPIISRDIEIHVIDLTTRERVGTVLKAHKAFTNRKDCFFIFLDVSDKYVTSGAEDCKAYIWDRYHEVWLSQLPHSAIVNCSAFNPVDPEMLVSVGDDNKIKVWRSRNKVRHYKIDATFLPKGEERRCTILG